MQIQSARATFERVAPGDQDREASWIYEFLTLDGYGWLVVPAVPGEEPPSVIDLRIVPLPNAWPSG